MRRGKERKNEGAKEKKEITQIDSLLFQTVIMIFIYIHISLFFCTSFGEGEKEEDVRFDSTCPIKKQYTTHCNILSFMRHVCVRSRTNVVVIT